MENFLLARGPYLLLVAVIVIGVFMLLTHRTLLKAMVGLYVFQTGIILFFIMVAYKHEAIPPIVPHGHGEHVDPSRVVNPVPHALMLTAIVVGVATLGLGLSILSRIQEEADTIEDLREE